MTGTIPVAIQGAGLRFTGDLVDISLNGMLVHCSETLEAGTPGRVAISVGPDTFRSAVVVRRQVQGVSLGIEFSRMSARDRTLLQLLLMRLSGGQKSCLLDRESDRAHSKLPHYCSRAATDCTSTTLCPSGS